MQHLQKTRGSHPSSQKRFSFSCPAHPFKPHLPSSVSSSKFRILQPLCLPLLRKLPGCVPTISNLEHPAASRPKGTLMNSQTETIITIPNSAPPHCQQRTPSGRHCRMAVSDPDSGLCAKHAADRRNELDQADLAAVLVGDIQDFRDPVTINHSLGELDKLQARNKINPRRAAVMAYTATLLLRTLPAIARDTAPRRKNNDLL